MVEKANQIVAQSKMMCPLLKEPCVRFDCAWYKRSRGYCGVLD